MDALKPPRTSDDFLVIAYVIVTDSVEFTGRLKLFVGEHR